MDTYQITIEPVVTKVQRHTWIVTYSDIFKFKYLNLHLYRIAHLGIVLALTISSTFVMHLYEHEEKKFPKSGMFFLSLRSQSCWKWSAHHFHHQTLLLSHRGVFNFDTPGTKLNQNWGHNILDFHLKIDNWIDIYFDYGQTPIWVIFFKVLTYKTFDDVFGFDHNLFIKTIMGLNNN